VKQERHGSDTPRPKLTKSEAPTAGAEGSLREHEMRMSCSRRGPV